MTAARTIIRVRGTVQGVGFRPFVYRRATALGLTGTVRNDSDGVLIDVEGEPEGLAALERVLAVEAPPLARVESVRSRPAEPEGRSGFAIVETDGSGVPNAPVGVDTAMCAACLDELDDRGDRRFRYPFTNCTDCGPRYTIVRSIPYDRPATTMAAFTQCDRCQAEYDDPLDRRFHAQPNACPTCGPTLSWTPTSPARSSGAAGDLALRAAVAALAAGGVVAVKGVGGYHLAADATDEGAVALLRRRKRRDAKPFAVLVRDLATAGRLCVLDAAAAAALASRRRPIVLVRRRDGAGISGLVAPGLGELGLLLPYSPLHHLLAAALDRPLVLTSGNLSDEPIAHDDADALDRLGLLAEGVLAHDRPIHIRCDDSVARSTPRGLQLLRRSRGYAPEPFALPVESPLPLLALGAELKSTVAVAKGGQVVASHHLGDLEHPAAWAAFRQAIDHLCGLVGVVPEVAVCDLHPEYLSSKLARELDVALVEVQHHHAHVAACLVEHGRADRVVALAFDGLGYGPDGTFWGGEVLVADLLGSERAASLVPVPLLGGGRAVREPWRMAAAWAGVDALPSGIDRVAAGALLDHAARGRSPVTTSAGRLFDAVAVLLGGRPDVSFEAQAAIELEAVATAADPRRAPRYEGLAALVEGVLDPRPLLAAIVKDRERGIPTALLARAFHEAFAAGAAHAAAAVAAERGIGTVVLTGGVFQNALLSTLVVEHLVAAGLEVLEHGAVPPNDGGISLGQAAVAAARLAAGRC